MQYRENPRNGDKLSQLGFGCMRFPRRGVGIDQPAVNEMVRVAVENGLNYFDTAHMYPGSEAALGAALAACGARDRVLVATKLPVLRCRKTEDFDRIFAEELERLQTDHIDYYFMHMLWDTITWDRLKSIGIEEWIQGKKETGAIRNVGFSFHGGRADFVAVLDAYDWDFCMIQFNYLDENNQAGYSGLQYAHKKGLPVFVMEPLRGGLLVNKMPKAAVRAFHEADPNRSLAEWGLRWVWNRPEVTCVLSGMSSMEQLSENLAIANDAAPGHLDARATAAYENAVSALNKMIKVPCTGCGYCVPCPKGVDIPSCFASYNESYTSSYAGALSRYGQVTGAWTARPTDASLCVKCGQCEAKCPQKIKISEELPKVRRRMLSPLTQPLFRLARLGLSRV